MGLRFDLLHVHVLTRTAVIPFFRSIFTGKPYIISEYWTRYLPEASGYRGFLRKSATALVVRRATAASALSGYLREAMQRCGLQNKRFVVIPPAIDTELFSPSHPAVSDGKIRFLHISTFADEAKNVTGILRVVKRLAERRNDFECCLVGGEPPHVAPVLKLAGELGLAGTTVHYTGARFGADLAEEIRRSHFLVMFSNYETFSVVIQESLACGRPVVATSAGPLPALVGQESGILVTPGNEDELLDAIERMIGHVYEYDPAKLHDLVHRRFGLASVARAWTDTYRLF
jgi:glycosyltransferase involved in cell wall biosynthesis